MNTSITQPKASKCIAYLTLDIILQDEFNAMVAEGFIKIIEGATDGNPDSKSKFAMFGPRTFVEIGVDGIIDFIEQVFVSENQMAPQHRKAWRSNTRKRLGRWYDFL